jgi:hypothetical protein
LTHRNRFLRDQLNLQKDVKIWEDGKVSVIEEKNNDVYVHLIFCPTCHKKSNKRVVTSGFQWAINPNGLYGSMTFIKLSFVCGTCATETPLPVRDLAVINGYAQQNIDRVHFPSNTRTAIKAQIEGMTQY